MRSDAPMHEPELILMGSPWVTVGSLRGPKTCGPLSAGIEKTISLHCSQELSLRPQETGFSYAPIATATLLSPPVNVSQGMQISMWPC